MTRHTTIAGVVLTLNEEKDLGRALRSLAWCDELLVIDSGSSDCTQDVAEEFGARFLQHIQNPPFLITEQRNWALNESGVKSDWVLFIDADEEVGPTLAANIRECIKSADGFDAYNLTPRFWFLGQWLRRTQGYPNWHPRLLKLGTTSFVGGVWETFLQPANVGKIYVPYEHYAFSKGIDDWLERHQRYAEWEACCVYEHISSNRPSEILTPRSRRLRYLATKLWPARPVGRFAQKYLLQLGFLEGWQGLVFSLLMAFYELIIVVKIIQKLRSSKGMHL